MYYIQDVKIAIDANGNGLVVWTQFDNRSNNVWCSRYTAGSSWGTPTLISTNNNPNNRYSGNYDPQIAMDAGGNALLVWNYQDQMGGISIWSNRYNFGSGWGEAALIKADVNTVNAYNPQITIDASGNALAVWYQLDYYQIDGSTRTNIWSNRYTVGNGWDKATLIGSDASDPSTPDRFSSPQIAIDPNGNALAVWMKGIGTRSDIASNRFE